MTKKIIIVLIVIFVIIISFYLLKSPISLGKIEASLSYQTLDKSELNKHIKDIIRQVTNYELTSTEISKVDSMLVNRFFLTKNDSTLIKKILVLDHQKATEKNSAFFKKNKIALFRLFLNILNNEVYQRYFKSDNFRLKDDQIKTADWIAHQFSDLLNFNLFNSELEFYKNLSQDHLKDKLHLEFYYKEVYKLLSKKSKNALHYLGAGTALARKIKDRKREIEFLSQLQYFLNESYGFTNITTALGDYLLNESNKMGHIYNSALVHYYNGLILIDKGMFTEALKQLELSKHIYSMFDHHSMLVLIYERMGVANRRLGKFEIALKNYQDMFELDRQNDESYARIYYLLGVGLVQFEMGLFPDAEKSYTEALNLAQSLKDRHNEAIALINLGELNFELGDYNKAVDYHQKALQVFEVDGTPHSIAEVWINLTKIHAMNRNIADARESASNAVKFLSKFNFGLLNANSYLSIGKLQLEIGDFPNALESFNMSLVLFKEIEALPSQVETLNLIGETHRRLKHFEIALNTLNEASNIESQFPITIHESDTYFNLAKVYKDLGKIQQAESFLSNSITQVKNIASRLHNNEQRSNFSQKIQPIFESMVLLQLDQNEPKKALFYAEQERAQVFNILLQEQPQETLTHPPVTSRLSINLPSISNYEYDSQFISALQNEMDKNVIAVEYELTDSLLVIWVIGKNTFESVKIDMDRDKIEQLVSEFRNCANPHNLSTRTKINSSFQTSMEKGQKLFHILIAPIEKYISNSELIYFIPDESLNYLPFAALVTPRYNYLIQDYAIVNMSSAAILQRSLEAMSKENNKNDHKTLLSVAANPELKQAKKEAIEVAGLLPKSSHTLLGYEATELALRDMLTRKFNIVLISSHGKISEKTPYYSALVLSKDSTAVDDAENDGLLMVHEIQELKLNSTDLVYLSSCESASGKLYYGEGIVGIQRAFIIAGSQSVIANLWKIEDQSAKELTIDFFRLWFSNTHNKAEALRQAQLRMIARLQKNPLYNYQPHPFFWAPATLTGSYN